MKEYSFEGRTAEEALLKASEELKMNIRDMDYDVIEGESRMFGLVKKVTVNVKLPDGKVREVEEYNEDNNVVELPVKTEPDEDEQKTVPMIGDEAGKVLDQIISLMDMTATATVEETEQEIRIQLISDEPDGLTGKDGRVLSSLQFLLNRIMNHKSEIRKHVLIDMDGFREKREEQLKEDAIKLANKAVETKKILTMGPINSKDRRIVHLALKENSEVSTRSEGTGPHRRVLIIPRGYTGPRPQNGGRKRGRRQRRNEPSNEPKSSTSD